MSMRFRLSVTASCLPWVAWGTNSEQLCDLRHSMQLVVSPVMKGINFLALVQQDHNLQDPWATGDLLFAGHLSRTLQHSLPVLAKAW